jgi:hypothetical protein
MVNVGTATVTTIASRLAQPVLLLKRAARRMTGLAGSWVVPYGGEFSGCVSSGQISRNVTLASVTIELRVSQQVRLRAVIDLEEVLVDD